MDEGFFFGRPTRIWLPSPEVDRGAARITGMNDGDKDTFNAGVIDRTVQSKGSPTNSTGVS